MSGIIHGMGHSREDKARSHQRIVEIAARRFRESGTTGPGVAELMQEAGLTHGGFYKHFGSRDDLVAEAVQRALVENDGVLTELLAEADDPLVAFVDWYASAEHRDGPGSGCAVVALGADVPRSDPRVRAAYSAQVQRYLARLESLLGDRRRAAAALGTLVGSVLVARAVGPGALSDEILAAARDAVTTSAGAGAAEPSGADA
jgi:TetR/AcrR family transcriptional regulator, transcriptional repressor for nem operon